MENKTPRNDERHPKHVMILDLKNILAILAVICFAGSLFIDDRQFLLKAVAYGVGALAYLGELMAMTHMFKKTCRRPRTAHAYSFRRYVHYARLQLCNRALSSLRLILLCSSQHM